MTRRWLTPSLWALGVCLVVLGVLDLDPTGWLRDLYYHYRGWGGGEQAILGGGIIIAAAFGMTLLDRIKPPAP